MAKINVVFHGYNTPEFTELHRQMEEMLFATGLGMDVAFGESSVKGNDDKPFIELIILNVEDVKLVVGQLAKQLIKEPLDISGAIDLTLGAKDDWVEKLEEHLASVAT